MSNWALLVLLFPFIGFLFWFSAFCFGWKTIHLLKNGEFTTGTLKERTATNTKINDQTVYRLEFEFQTESGETHVAVAKTHQTQLLEDDVHEPLLYDPMNPKKSTLMDHLPGSPRISNEGEVMTRSATTALLSLLIPSISVALISVFVYFRLFS